MKFAVNYIIYRRGRKTAFFPLLPSLTSSYKDILYSLPKRLKRQVVSDLGCRVIFIKLSMEWNSSV